MNTNCDEQISAVVPEEHMSRENTRNGIRRHEYEATVSRDISIFCHYCLTLIRATARNRVSLRLIARGWRRAALSGAATLKTR